MKRLVIFNSLFARLVAVFLTIVIVLGGALLSISRSMSEHYGQEVMQCLNASVASYITEQKQLIGDDLSLDEAALDQLASHAMILNPGLEIYVLDTLGNILSHRLPPETVITNKISVEPLRHYFAPDVSFPLLGDDPRNTNQRAVFSAAPIYSTAAYSSAGPQLLGYVYVVVGGKIYQELRDSVAESYVFRVGGLLMVGGLLAASLIGSVVFFFLTRRLTRLRKILQTVDLRFQQPEAADAIQSLQTDTLSGRNDEVDQLSRVFGQMASHIHQQYTTLRSLDESRRDLIANVSHDLRTPLASLQGYIETLIIKNDQLQDNQRQIYLSTAIKNCQRLSSLIAELFELSRLESGGAVPKVEPFSLLELIHDCVQEFQYKAQINNIHLAITDESVDGFVVADIAMIHRVLQNLVENAIEHTPENGAVTFILAKQENQLCIQVADSGHGISTHEIPFIFDRYYQAQQCKSSDKIGTGLGLAIVKRILELHNTHINVSTELNKGTAFSFSLPLYHA